MNNSKNRKLCLIAVIAGSVVIAAVFGIYAAVKTGSVFKNTVSTSLFFALLAAAIGMYYLCWHMLFNKKRPIHIVFIVVAAIACLFYGVMFPPGTVDDETVHIPNVYLLSNRILGLEQTVSEDQSGDSKAYVYYEYRTGEYNVNTPDSKASVYVYYDSYMRAGDSELWDELIMQTPYTETTQKLFEGYAHPFYTDGQSELVPARMRDHSATPVSYLPAVIGVSIARLLGLSLPYLLLLGRLFMCAFFVLGVSWSIKRMPFAKTTVFLAGMFPMSLHIAFSFNYDCVLLTLCFMLFAQIMHMAYGENAVLSEKPSFIRETVITAVLVLLLSGIKVGSYISIVLLMLLIPKTKVSARKKYVLFVGMLLLGAAAAVLSNISALATSADGYYIGSRDITTYSLSSIFDDPIGVIKLFFNTFIKKTFYWAIWSVGSNLSWMRLEINKVIVICVLLLIPLSFLKSKNDPFPKLKLRQRMLLFLPVVICALFFMVGMLFWETSPGDETITGIHGRYFTPLLPPTMLAFSGINIKGLKWQGEIVIPVICALNYLVLLSALATLSF